MDLSKNTNLKNFYMSFNYELKELDLSKNIGLERIECCDGVLEDLILPQSNTLKHLACANNKLAKIDVSYYTELEGFFCYQNPITSIDLTHNTKLLQASIANTSITEIDLTNNKALTFLSCHDINIATLDLSQNTELETLYCHQTNLTEIDLNNQKKLKVLTIEGCKLNSLDLSNCRDLEELDCNYNNLKTLDLSKNNELKEVYCYANQLTNLNVAGCSNITVLNCSVNQLKNFNGKGCASLYELDCSNNQLTSFDLSGCAILGKVYFSNNNLTTLEDRAFDNRSLERVYLDHNNLVSINPRAFIPFEDCIYLDMRYNNLTSVNLENCFVDGLAIDGNPLTSLDLAASGLEGRIDREILESRVNILVEDADGLYHVDISQYVGKWDSEKISDIQVNGAQLESDQKTVTWETNTNPSVTFKYNTGIQNSLHKPCYLQVTLNLLTTLDINADNFPDENFREYVKTFDQNNDNKLSGAERCNVTSMDVSNREIADLTGIASFPNLESLSCNDDKLTAIDLSNSTELKSLYCQNNQLTVLDLSKNTKLEYLNCSHNSNLKTLGLSYGRLVNLNCEGIGLEELSLAGAGALKELNCAHNSLQTLDLTEAISLDTLYCGNNNLNKLSVPVNSVLRYLDCQGNQLTELDLSGAGKLTYLNCNNNLLAELVTASAVNLEILYCANNHLMAIDLMANTALKNADCSNQTVQLEVNRSDDRSWSIDLFSLINDSARVSNITTENAVLEDDGKTVFWSDPSSKPFVKYIYASFSNAPMDVTLTLIPLDIAADTAVSSVAVSGVDAVISGKDINVTLPCDADLPSAEDITVTACDRFALVSDPVSDDGLTWHFSVTAGDDMTVEEYTIHVTITKHELVKTDEEASSCTKEGHIAYWTCGVCKKIFSNENAVNKITLDDTVTPALGHHYSGGRCTRCGATEPGFTPVITDGADGVWQKGSKDDLSFTSNAAFAHFVKVQVDNQDLDASSYTVKEGSTIVALKVSYLETLSEGKHIISIVSETGAASTEFTIIKATETTGDIHLPLTGDNTMVWMLSLIGAAGCLAAIVLYRHKKNYGK